MRWGPQRMLYQQALRQIEGPPRRSGLGQGPGRGLGRDGPAHLTCRGEAQKGPPGGYLEPGRAWAAGPLAGGLAPPRGSLRPLPGPGPASGGGGPLQSPSQQTRSCKGASPPPPQHNHAIEESKRSIPKYSQVFLSILYYYAVLLSTLKYSEVFLDIRRYC